MSSGDRLSGVSDISLAGHGIVAGYGEAPVLQDVSVAVNAGEVLAIVGPNGAGKSTLLKALLGIVSVRQGSVLLNGVDVTNEPLEELARRGVGYVPQGDDVFDTLRVHENLEMGGILLTKRERTERMERASALFPQLKSMLHRFAGTLSGGERKMVAIARALMPDPSVLLLDEPTAGLAAQLTDRVLQEQVRPLADLGKAVIIVEQRAVAALGIADRGCVLVTGSVALTGTGDDVLGHPDMAEVFLGGVPTGGRA